MARKRLIKGANAARVEARISRVPVDLADEGVSIFAALRAAEEATTPSAASDAAAPKSLERAPKTKKSAAREKKSETKPEAGAPRNTASAHKGKERAPRSAGVPATTKEAPLRQPEARPPAAEPAQASSGPPKRVKLRSSDFSVAEIKAILRCCVEYRNRLPTYLQSAKREVEILDSIIAKCGPASSD